MFGKKTPTLSTPFSQDDTSNSYIDMKSIVALRTKDVRLSSPAGGLLLVVSTSSLLLSSLRIMNTHPRRATLKGKMATGIPERQKSATKTNT
jgi:hypothetical protein